MSIYLWETKLSWIVQDSTKANVVDVINKTDDQTKDWILTFNDSPIVPAPTSWTQAVNKDYVDNNAWWAALPLLNLAFFYGGSKTLFWFASKDDWYVYIWWGNGNQAIQRYKKQAWQLIINNSDTVADDEFILTSDYLWWLTSILSSDNYLYTTSTALPDILYRHDVSDKSVITMTISWFTLSADNFITSDWTYLYIFLKGTTNCYKISVSWTTATYVSTITLPITISDVANKGPLWYANNFYYISNVNSIVKCSDSWILDYQIYTTLADEAKWYGGQSMFFEYNNYIMLWYLIDDTEDTTWLNLQIIEDLN